MAQKNSHAFSRKRLIRKEGEGEREMDRWSERKGKGQRLQIAIRLKKESRYPVSNVWVRLLGAVLG